MSLLFLLVQFLAAEPDVTTSQFDIPQEEEKPSCFFCTLPLPKNTKNLDALCGDDPMTAVCSNMESSEAADRRIKKEVEDTIAEGEKKVLKSLGFNSKEGAIRDLLKREGYEISDKSLEFKNAAKEGSIPNLSGGTFPTLNKCFQALNRTSRGGEEEGEEVDKAALVRERKKELSRLRGELAQYQQYAIRMSAKDVESFYNSFVERCENEAYDAFRYVQGSPYYRKFRGDCNNRKKFAQQVEDLYRISGPSKTYNMKAAEFTKSLFYIHYLDTQSPPPSARHSGIDQSIRNLDHNIEQAAISLRNICQAIDNSEVSSASKLLDNFAVKLHTNKIFVDHMVENLHNGDTFKRYKEMVEASRHAVISRLDDMFPSSPHRRKITRDFNDIKLLLPGPADKSKFIKRSDGLYLDENKISKNGLDRHLGSYFEPSLDDFRGFNAHYLPQIGLNATPHVCPMGTALQKGLTNPYMSFSIFAHEFGHHIDAQTARDNGYNIDYSKLLQCYQSSLSINMRAEQSGETTADYVSASAIAHELSQLPQNQRRNVLVEALKDACEFANKKGYMAIESGVYPAWSLRVNGIYMAHPKIREAIGCNKEKPYKYKICPPAQ